MKSIQKKIFYYLKENPKKIEVPRPYHLEIDGKIYNLSWLQFVLQVIGGLAFLVGLYGIWVMLVLAS